MQASTQRSRQRKKPVPLRKYQRHLNIGIFIFVVIFIYMVISVGIYLSQERVSIYEITVQGSITQNKTYTGIILREEEVISAQSAGYVNYYARDGERVKVGDTVFSLDESGQVSSMLFEEDHIDLKDTDLSELKTMLSRFAMGYDPIQFSELYDLKVDMDYMMLELANMNNIASLNEFLGTENNALFHIGVSDKTGTIAYYTDAYEGYTPQMLTAQDFENDTYEKDTISISSPLEAGNPVYKIVTSEDWTITFPIEEAELERFREKDALTIRIQKDNFQVTAPFSILTGTDGTYGVLNLSRYMIRYLQDRYLTIEIVENEEKGYKIPITAVTEKNFYTIPIEYLTTDENNNRGFQLETYDAQTQSTITKFVAANLYSATDRVYYVDMELFEPGTYLVRPDSSERYQIGATQPLKGVYTVNQGYTVFRVIEIISESSEYYIVKTGTSYGLSMYDHIIMNSKTVTENQIIFQ